MATVTIIAFVLAIWGTLLLTPLVTRSRRFAGGPVEIENRLLRALEGVRKVFRRGRGVLVGHVSDSVLEAFSIASVLLFISGVIVAFHVLWKYWEFLRDYWYAFVPLLLFPAITEGLLLHYGEGQRRVPARLGCLVLLIVMLNLVSIGIGSVLTLVLLYVLAAVAVGCGSRCCCLLCLVDRMAACTIGRSGEA